MSVLRDTTVGFGFIVTLSGHAKRDEDLWQDPEHEIEKLLAKVPEVRGLMGPSDDDERYPRVSDVLFVSEGTDAWSSSDDDNSSREIAVLLKEKLGGFGTHGVCAINNLKTATPKEEHALLRAIDHLGTELGRKIKKFPTKALGWAVVGTVC